jgi:general secretion pathway protein G
MLRDAFRNGERLSIRRIPSGVFLEQAQRWRANELMSKRKSARGFTLLELIVTVTILSILSGMAVPVARLSIRREKERMLRENLRTIRDALDRYYDGSTTVFHTAPSVGYPPDLKALVEGVEVRGYKLRLLREIPVDPMTGNREWGLHSMEDDPDSDSWDGGQIWDVYSKSDETALDGTKYRDW